jgi:CRISPR/Cas system-associated exonuclease Cas4 (RecB family)
LQNKCTNCIPLSASGLWLYDYCPNAYKLHYINYLKPAKQGSLKLFISKVVHELGAHWVVLESHKDWEEYAQNLILKHIRNEGIYIDQQFSILGKITDLLERYIELLKRLRVRGKSISVEETYGSKLKRPIPITDTWAFRGAADIVVFEEHHAVIWDAKWSWSPEKLSQNQINIYATVHETVLKQPVSQVGFIVFGPQKIVTFKFNAKQKEETITKMNNVTKMILENKFIPQPEPSKCKYCDYRSYCEHKLEGEELPNGEVEIPRGDIFYE